jgi:hypothetical protein
MRTAGRIRSMAFAGIKHHKTDLLDKNEYRSDCWLPHLSYQAGSSKSSKQFIAQ